MLFLFAARPLLLVNIIILIGHTIDIVHGNPRTNELDSAELGRREQRLRLLLDGKHFESKANPAASLPLVNTMLPSLNTVENNSNNNNNNTRTDSNSSNNSSSNGQQTKYKVIRTIPETDVQLKLLERLEVNGADLELNFWTSPVRTKSGVDIMLPARKVTQLRQYLHKHRMHTEVIIDDVERLIIQRERKIFGVGVNSGSRNDGAAQYGRLLADQPVGNNDDPSAADPITIKSSTSSSAPHLDFHHYNSYTQMVAWMRSLAKRYPRIVQFISVGKSHEGRGIVGLEIGSRGYRKRAFWIDGGIHAREWAAPHTAMYFIHQLTSRYGHDEDITRLVNEITWIIVPLLNPDGYEYTRSSTNPNVRLWRKNRSPTHCIRDQWGRSKCCKGVDLNRNFDFHFKESGSSDDPCSEIYQGKNAFSEPEAKAVRDAILSNRYRGRIDGFITLHTYSQIWIHPFGHKRDSYPGDVHDLAAVGKKATAALSRLYGTKYVVGSGADTLYPASGGSEDWAKESANIKFVYLLELRPDEKNWDGFILDEGQLMPTASETWAGVRVVADAIIQRARAKRVLISSSGSINGGTSIVSGSADVGEVTETAGRTDTVEGGAGIKLKEGMRQPPSIAATVLTMSTMGRGEVGSSDAVPSGADRLVGSSIHRISGVSQYHPAEKGEGPSAILMEKSAQKPMRLSTFVGGEIEEEWMAARDKKPQQQTTTDNTQAKDLVERPRRQCVDRRRACKRWVLQSAHICQAVPVFMGEQCARSCGFCTY